MVKSNLFINEVRVPLTSIQNLRVFKYQSPGLSSGHKKYLEQALLRQRNRVAIFEGDALFCLAHKDEDMSEEKDYISEFLSQHIRTFNPQDLQPTKLQHAPERVIERLAFALISARASSQGVFTIYGRTLFKPTSDQSKEAHVAVETTAIIEDGFVKVYLVPTYIGLVNIAATYRQERYDLELVGLCRFRSECDLAAEDGSCPYIVPGRLGYYVRETPLSKLPVDRQESFQHAYKDCPEISAVNQVVLVKATKKAKNSLAYPPYVIHSRLSEIDFQTRTNIARKYRDATLMLANKRFGQTRTWLKDIFAVDDNGLNTGKAEIQVGGVQIPIEILLPQAHPLSGQSSTGYKPIWFQEQQVVNNPQYPRGSLYGGGWLFSTQGAYDRDDINRPFDKVHPYIIVPNDGTLLAQTRKLLQILSNGEYRPKNVNGDKPFTGLNQPENQKKYNVEFVNVWDQEESIFTTNDTELDFLRAAQDIKREWNKSNGKDRNRIVLVVSPASDSDDESVTLYHKLKTIFIEEGIPSQFVTFDTLAKLDNPSVAFGPILDSLWLNIYAKMGGKPWRLANELGNVHCFIGIGFGLNPRHIGKHIYAGVAHVFDKYGSWIDVATDSRQLSDEERKDFEGEQKYLEGTASFKISQDTTESIVYDALRLYQQQQTKTGEPAKNIVLHKLGYIHECEIIGFLEGIRRNLGTLDGCRIGIVQIEQEHKVRLYGDEVKGRAKEDRTVFRTSGLVLNKTKIVLATTGRVYRQAANNRILDSYTGIGTPHPLLLTSKIPPDELLKKYGCRVDQFYDIETLGRHVMALTQLHWGSTRDNIRLPITTLYAQKVAELISKTGARIDTWASYHRPWFL